MHKKNRRRRQWRKLSRSRRVGPIRSVDHFEVIQGVSVGGATLKDVLCDPKTGRMFIAKTGRRNNDLEVMTEYAIYVIGRSIGVRVARAQIARFRGKLRFLSEYFLDQSSAEELVHGVQLFRELYDDTTVREIVGQESKEQSFFTVQAVKAAFGAHYLHLGVDVEERLFDDFVALLTHDALIGGQDRHHENWGVIVRREIVATAPRFAPLYDSARGLFCSYADGRLGEFFGRRGSAKIDDYVRRSRPLVGFQGLIPTDGRKHITHPQLLAAVYKAYPSQQSKIEAVLDAYDG